MSNLFEYLAIGSRARAVALTLRPTSANGRVPERGRAAGHRARGRRASGTRARTRGRSRHVDLTIPAGESVALVGENGAGKTTLVKLLTRLYEPTEGRILLDGRDLRDWRPDDAAPALRRPLPGLQPVPAQGARERRLRQRRAHGRRAAHRARGRARRRRASSSSSLAGGLDAPLGRWFQDGTELSGGQWQKIALARAFMREEADILVLDEPTAALDAEAEHAVFERFRELAEGRTTIVISHRFPTVRMARKIVVLDHGAIVEEGTHDELVAQGGKYARMFALQAEGYR